MKQVICEAYKKGLTAGCLLDTYYFHTPGHQQIYSTSYISAVWTWPKELPLQLRDQIKGPLSSKF